MQSGGVMKTCFNPRFFTTTISLNHFILQEKRVSCESCDMFVFSLHTLRALTFSSGKGPVDNDILNTISQLFSAVSKGFKVGGQHS